MKLTQNQKILFVGDSITDAGRTRPDGEGLFDPRGKGFVSQVEALLTSTYPALRIRVVNQGNGGNTVKDLRNRWQADVLDRKPDWVVILIGINDVWRQFDSPLQTESHVLPAEYTRNLEELIRLTQPKVSGLVLMTPFYIERLRDDAMRAQMDQYGAIVRDLAVKYGAICVDLQAAYDEVLKHFHSSALAWDRIHPNQAGHMVITKAFLKSIGFAW